MIEFNSNTVLEDIHPAVLRADNDMRLVEEHLGNFLSLTIVNLNAYKPCHVTNGQCTDTDRFRSSLQMSSVP
jgi:hypothetical protein